MNAKEWLDNLRQRPANDFDSVVLFLGDEGKGKSTLALQIATQVDPSFNVDRIAFDIDTYIGIASTLKPGEAALLDELAIGGASFDAMKPENRRMKRFFTTNRTLRLVHLLCSPRLAEVEKFLHRRAAFSVYISKRGLSHVRKPLRTEFGKGTYWKEVLRLRFGPFSGPLWADYLRRKEAFARVAGLDRDGNIHEDDLGDTGSNSARVTGEDLRRRAGAAFDDFVRYRPPV